MNSKRLLQLPASNEETQSPEVWFRTWPQTHSWKVCLLKRELKDLSRNLWLGSHRMTPTSVPFCPWSTRSHTAWRQEQAGVL